MYGGNTPRIGNMRSSGKFLPTPPYGLLSSFSPSGTPDNSPAIHRGLNVPKLHQVPQGRPNVAVGVTPIPHLKFQISNVRTLPAAPGGQPAQTARPVVVVADVTACCPSSRRTPAPGRGNGKTPANEDMYPLLTGHCFRLFSSGNTLVPDAVTSSSGLPARTSNLGLYFVVACEANAWPLPRSPFIVFPSLRDRGIFTCPRQPQISSRPYFPAGFGVLAGRAWPTMKDDNTYRNPWDSAAGQQQLAEKLLRLGWREGDLDRLAKGDAGKVAAAVRLCAETVMPVTLTKGRFKRRLEKFQT